MLDHPWNHSSFDRPEQEKAGDIGTEIMFELTATSSLFHDPPQRLSSRCHGKIHVSFTEGRDDDTASTLSASTSMDDDSVTDFRQVTSAKISVAAAVHCQPNKTSEENCHLCHNEHNDRDFKSKIVTGKSRQQLVKFALDLLTEVISV
jgi:hypothetical protein